jgi:hypothetical protein
MPPGGDPSPVPQAAPVAGGKSGDPKVADSKPKPAAPILIDKEEFLNDPLIRQALEVFKGRILEVRAPAEGS